MIGNVIKCEDISIIVRILAKSVKVLQFLVPIILIVLIIFDLFKVFVGQTDDKAKKDASNKIIQRVVYAIIIFLVPIVVNFVLSSIAPKTNGLDPSWYDCWVESFDETLSFSGSNGSSGSGSTKKICENYGKSDCPSMTCYLYSGGCHSVPPTPSPIPTTTPQPVTPAPKSTETKNYGKVDDPDKAQQVTPAPEDANKKEADFWCDIDYNLSEQKCLRCNAEIDGEFWFVLPENSKIYWDGSAITRYQTCSFYSFYNETGKGCLIPYASNDYTVVSDEVTVQFNPTNKDEYKSTAKIITIITD